MTWQTELITDRRITPEIMEDIIEALPDSITENLIAQSWGWSMAVDVMLNDDAGILIRGDNSTFKEFGELSAYAIAYELLKAGIPCEMGEFE
jgi:hypothetical protein